MMHKVTSVRAKDSLIIEATFLDGTVKEYDITNMFPICPQLMELKNNEKLFRAVQIDVGGYGISWNDNLDLEAETIWKEGTAIAKKVTNPLLEMAHSFTEVRDNVGLTQKQLAERTGIYQADISKIERGIGNPSIGTLQRLAEGMGMTLSIAFVPKDDTVLNNI